MSEYQKSQIAKREEEILKFWQDNTIFQKTLEKPSEKGSFVFYDGPPFATGLPHYGHILAGTMKDVIPRYKTMCGYHVPRVWGWDCHGLPIENLIQKELNVATKKDIEALGVEKFNETARSSVFRYEDEWKKIIPRTGRWVDMDKPYTTMDQSYTESVWWGFKELHKKGLVYEDFKSMHISPLLETPLSNFEVNQNYKDITDISVYVKFELKDEPGTYMLAWTTTPWTLFGNTAIAIHKDATYLKVKVAEDVLIFAKDLLEKVKSLKSDQTFEVLREVQGEELVGKSYVPPFEYYYNQKDLENYENGWKIYHADFVTTEDGTGVAHEAPAFGEDDLILSQKYKLPFVQHVNIDGTIKDDIEGFAGLQAKPKEDPTATDVEVIKALAHKGVLFAKEKIVHSYPHCWRTDAPLLNYAMSSWFIKVTDIKHKLVSENKRVNWVPEDIRNGRFGKWLEGARDWAVSRNRFWGAPMPIWQSEDGKDVEVIGSIEELQSKVPDQIEDIYIMRHGESEKNIAGVYSDAEDKYPLTQKGREQAKKSATDLRGKVDMIYTSPVRRAKETAQIVADVLGVDIKEAIEIDEVDSGSWDEKKRNNAERGNYDSLSDQEYYTTKRGETGEAWEEIEKRSYEFVAKTVQENPGKRILFVTHAGVTIFLIKALRRMSISRARTMLEQGQFLEYATAYNFKIDRNTLKEFDFHRPYIDAFTWKNKDGKLMKRVPDVFDTWMDSGSMPFAQKHYPFEDEKLQYPAEFIGEGLDQTRGWFYVLAVLGSGLLGKVPYKNVIVNGLVLAEDGRKMSKSLQNYPPVEHIFDHYGADAMRYYLLASPVVRAEDLSFSEKGVDEVVKKVMLRLKNVQSFFEMYKEEETQSVRPESVHVLDTWILARLLELQEEVTQALEKYELDRATRPFADFVDDLSTWYLRRSRDRFKGEDVEDKKQATQTLGYVLRETSKLLAPIMPFLAEDLYQGLRNEDDVESVHLEKWPRRQEGFWSKLFGNKTKNPIILMMKEVRGIISEALELRAREGIKVRQPLQSLVITKEYSKELLELVKEEVNVKNVVAGEVFGLDFDLTEELLEEGSARDIVRGIQDMRKKAGLVPEDEILLTVTGDDKVVGVFERHKDFIFSQVKARGVEYDQNEGESVTTHFGDLTVSIST